MFQFLIILLISAFSININATKPQASHALSENTLHIKISNKNFNIVYAPQKLFTEEASSLSDQLSYIEKLVSYDITTYICTLELPCIYNLPNKATLKINKKQNVIIISNPIDFSEKYGKSDEELLNAYQESFFSIISFFINEFAEIILSEKNLEDNIVKEVFLKHYLKYLESIITQNMKSELSKCSLYSAYPMLEAIYQSYNKNKVEPSWFSRALLVPSILKAISTLKSTYDYVKYIIFKKNNAL